MSRKRSTYFASLLVGTVVAGALLLSSAALADPHPVTPPTLPGVAGLPGPIAPAASPAKNLKLLRVEPASGPVGTKFTVSGEGLPANEDFDIVWATSTVRYVLNPMPDNVEYYGRKIDKVNVVLGKAKTDAAGKLDVALTAPVDYGDVHDIYAVSDGTQLAKAGFQINRQVSVSPSSGPIGSPITITISGLGSLPYTSTVAVLYDNHYTGFISGTTTRGSAQVQIRAAGPVGVKAIEVAPASAAVPYLDIEQSAVAFVGKYRTKFRVTADKGLPRNRVDLPGPVEPTETSRTTMTASAAQGVTASLSRRSGIILTKVGVEASGLDPNAPVLLQWMTAIGTRATASGWQLEAIPLGQATTGAGGSLSTTVQVPDNLGGWHTVRLVQGGKVKAELPYYVLRSFVSVSPRTVKEGEVFTIHLKGFGWTELDNTTAVTYDNSYLGYACGFYSRGDITMNMVATGGPGTHLIDLYPAIYKGKGSDTWLDQVPLLNFKYDAPGLALGYRLPAIRLAIKVVP
jgi:hypothetical protein